MKEILNNLTLKQNIIYSSLSWIILTILYYPIIKFFWWGNRIDLNIEIWNKLVIHEDFIWIFLPILLVLGIQLYIFLKLLNQNDFKKKMINLLVSIFSFLIMSWVISIIILLFAIANMWSNLP